MPQGIFTGFEGVVTHQVLEQLRRQRLRNQLQANQDNVNLTGQQFGARQAGTLLGTALGRAFRRFRDPQGDLAARRQTAIEEAQEGINPEDFATNADGSANPVADIDQRIAVVTQTIGNLKEQGLGQDESADQLRQNLAQLRQQRLEQLKLTGQVESTNLENQLKSIEIKQRRGEQPGRDELTRMLNQLESIDTSTPEGQRRFDRVQDRINKINAIVGRTEQDVDPKGVRDALGGIQDVQDNIDRLEGMRESFDPTFLTLEGKVRNFAAGIADMAGLQLGDETTESFKQYKVFQSNTIKNLNDTVRALTGAALSPGEVERVRKQIPNESDGPQAFQAKLENSLVLIEASKEKAIAIAEAEASGDPKARIRARGLSTVKIAQRIRLEREDERFLNEARTR